MPFHGSGIVQRLVAQIGETALYISSLLADEYAEIHIVSPTDPEEGIKLC